MNEVFRARCEHDEVIVMKSAFYGRMRRNRCITVDMGHLGCKSDVLDLADQRCSGRRQCELRMPYPAFEATRPCYDLQSYFKASYYCLKGTAIFACVQQLPGKHPDGYYRALTQPTAQRAGAHLPFPWF